MQAAEQTVQRRRTCEPLRVPGDVDGAGVPAAGQHEEAASPYMGDEGLIVEDQRVVLPRRAGPLLVGSRHAALELSGPADLSGDQDATVHEQ